MTASVHLGFTTPNALSQACLRATTACLLNCKVAKCNAFYSTKLRPCHHSVGFLAILMFGAAHFVLLVLSLFGFVPCLVDVFFNASFGFAYNTPPI